MGAGLYLTDHDESGGNVKCVRLTELETAAKLAYYAGKLFQFLRTLPPPPPP